MTTRTRTRLSLLDAARILNAHARAGDRAARSLGDQLAAENARPGGQDYDRLAARAISYAEVLRDEKGTNPVVRETHLRAYPGWTIREYADGMYDAKHADGSLGPGERSFDDALYFVKNGEPRMYDADEVGA